VLIEKSGKESKKQVHVKGFLRFDKSAR